MRTSESVICSYIDFLGDAEFLADAIAEHGIRSLGNAATDMTRSRERPVIQLATLFVRDVSIGMFSEEVTKPFREFWPTSGIFQSLIGCLSHDDLLVRWDACYTLGKLCYKENIPAMIQVFQQRLESDPLLMDHLLFEISWLEGSEDDHWDRVRQLSNATDVAGRWASLQVLERAVDNDPFPPSANEILKKLAKDRSDLIRNEARYRLDQIETQKGFRTMTGPKRKARGAERKERKRLATARPFPIFSDLEILFPRSMSGVDYSTDELLDFARQCQSQGRNEIVNRLS